MPAVANPFPAMSLADSPQRKATTDTWRSLFSNGEARCQVVVIRKYGQPLLILAGRARYSSLSLELYPAQSFKARRLRDALRLALKLRLLPLFFGEEWQFDPSDPLVQKLMGSDPNSGGFSILCGNPNTEGRRFMILTEAPGHHIVIKAGISSSAQQLVAREARLLGEIQHTRHTPGCAELFQTPRLTAFAIPFIKGQSPSPTALDEVASVLESWVFQSEETLGDLPAWKRLQAALPERNPALDKIESSRVATTLVHGDFAPWNIKVTPQNSWVVLDWERGEAPGVPGWDWFHFFIQSQVLVARLSPEQVFQRLTALIAFPGFHRYAEKTKICGIEWQLLAAYLSSMIHLTPPSEGLQSLKALARLVEEKIALNGPRSA